MSNIQINLNPAVRLNVTTPGRQTTDERKIKAISVADNRALNFIQEDDSPLEMTQEMHSVMTDPTVANNFCQIIEKAFPSSSSSSSSTSDEAELEALAQNFMASFSE